MRVAFFSTRKYDKEFFSAINKKGGFDHELVFFETQLNLATANLANGFEAICAFVNDRMSLDVLKQLKEGGTRVIALRCAGYNNVDLNVAAKSGIKVVRVPAYSPNAVAEHVLAMLLTLYRFTHKAYNRVREGNFSLEGMTGYEIFGKVVGIVGYGRIGQVAASIFSGFGCRVLVSDPYITEGSIPFELVTNEYLMSNADIISLHCPLNATTKYLVDKNSIGLMKDGVTIINTSRGGLLNTRDVYVALKSKKIGFLGIDVYEEEEKLFFEDLSTQIIEDDLFMRLTTFPNVLITGHQGFFTQRALINIAETSLKNLSDIEKYGKSLNEITLQ